MAFRPKAVPGTWSTVRDKRRFSHLKMTSGGMALPGALAQQRAVICHLM